MSCSLCNQPTNLAVLFVSKQKPVYLCTECANKVRAAFGQEEPLG